MKAFLKSLKILIIAMQKKKFEPDTEKIRVRLPKGREKIGLVSQLLGFRRMYVACTDGKTRMCRIPGRLRRRMWVKLHDVVIVEPWEDADEKGDIIFDYTRTQASWLRKRGMLKSLEEF